MTVVSKLMEIWVKAPALKGARLAIVSACLKHVNEAFYRKVLEEHDVVLEHCPENENQAFYGKIASIIRSSQPKSITVVTIDGSPHCFQIHAAVNEAVYILSNPIPRKHYVVIYDRVVEISPESIRVARYLHLVDELIKKYPEVLKKLVGLSLEYKRAIEVGDAVLKP